MGAPDSGMHGAEQGAADSLLTALRTIKADERARHATVLDYWLSIRGNKEFPPLHDLDPLEISDAGPNSILLELISGGQDAEVRHLGDGLTQDIAVDRIIDAPNPSVLACIAKKLPIVAISRDFLAFEDSYDTAEGWTRLWVTLLPLSSCGSWVDYVYAFVSVEKSGAKAAKPAPAPEPVEAVEESTEPEAVAGEESAAPEEIQTEIAAEEEAEAVTDEPEAAVEHEAEAVAEDAQPEAAVEDEPEAVVEEVVAEEPPAELAVEEEPVPESAEPILELEPEPEPEAVVEAAPSKPGFAKLIEGFANLTGFYGQSVNIDPAVPVEAEEEVAAEEAQAVEPETVESPAIETEAAEEPPVIAEEPPAPEQPAAEEPVCEAAEEVQPEVVAEIEPDPVEEPAAEPTIAPASEGTLKSKLDEVQAKADEAREAQLRATQALYQGLSAAYDFALDAENSPEEYLRLIEAQGLKIQLRAPMAPVAKLAFDGVCDAATIRQFEAVLAWALKVELPRGTLLERIENAGGIPELLNEFSKAA